MSIEKLSELSLWTKWMRPASVPYPNTWHRFMAKSKDGKMYKIKIVDLTPDRFKEAYKFLEDYFYPYEPTAACLKLLEDDLCWHNFSCKMKPIFEQRVTIIAVLDEDVPKPEIVGVLKRLVISKADEPAPNTPGHILQIWDKLFDELEKNIDFFTIFDTDTIIRDFGLCVKPEYRGLKIGFNLIATVEKLASAFDIKAAAIRCSAIETQVICEKLGYKLFNEIVYNEYKDDQGQVVFPIERVRSLKLMAIKYT